jgi:DNA-binding LytR/AlgR family response regulator
MGAEPNPLISESLKSLEIRLEPFGFLRCHKGHLVNLAHVIGLDAAGVHLSDGSSRPVGRAYRQTLLNALGMKLQ